MRDRRTWIHTFCLLVSALLLLPLGAAQAQDPACLDAPDGTPNDAVCVVDGVSRDFTEIDTGVFVLGGDGDLNHDGAHDITDLLAIVDHVIGTILLSHEDYAEADINGDGRVSFDDVGLALLRLLGVPKDVAVAQIEGGYGMVDNDVLFVTSGVRVGVGTANPAAALHVIGDVVVEGTITEMPPSPATAASRELFAQDGELGALLDELMRARGENAELTAKIELQERELAELAALRARLERVEAALALPGP